MWTQDAYIKAMNYAAEAHGEQKVQGKPYSYLYHISLVSMEIMACLQHEKHEKGDFILQCAILHDVLEDTETSSEHLLFYFSREVLDGVLALTKNTSIKADIRMKECLERIKMQPREIWMVKMADRISNLQEPPAHWDREKIHHYFGESQVIYDELHEASPYLAQRLAKKIEAYRNYLT